MLTHILRIRCRDRLGLIAIIAGELHRRGLNVINNGEFVDVESDAFFMRSEFTASVDLADLRRSLLRQLPEGAEVSISRREPKKMVILATKEPHCLGELLLRCTHNQLDGIVQAVISNHRDLQPLVERFDIPFHYLDHSGSSRDEHCAAIGEVVANYEPDYLVLAKYMRILTPQFVAAWPQRIVNIHHSFLPAFVGANPYRQAYERGVKIIGATAHFVTDDLDEGPIICQDVTPISHAHSVEDLAVAGRDAEKIVLSRALSLVLQERIFVHNNKTIIFD